jgi:hypothetical protein
MFFEFVVKKYPLFQDCFQEDPVHLAMIISRNLKEERRILAAAKSIEVLCMNLY